MNKNKGIIGIGLIIAIILGVIVIGGGAYYLGKSGSKQAINSPENNLLNNQNQNLPVDNNQQVNVPTPIIPAVSTDCTSSSKPSITVLSPNGGEIYQAGQQITVKWKICNVPANTQLTIGLSMSVASGSHTTSAPVIKNTPNDGSESFILDSSIYDYFGKTNGYPFKIYIGSGGPTGAYDESDNSFTINSSETISIALPTKYLSSQNWPPVVTTSSQSYSCNNIGVAPNTEGNNITAQRIINGKKYCITSVSDHAMSHTYTDYTYTTINGNGTKTTSFSLGVVSCGVYDKVEADQCQVSVSTFLNKLDVMVDSLM